MKNLLAAILFLFSVCAFGQSQGVSQRATNGISYGEMLVTGHINATNTSQTNILAGKFQQSTGKATALGASAFGNNTIASGQYSVAIGSRGQNGGTSALSAGTSNTITSGGLNSFAVGAGNFISGSVSTAIGTNNFIEGYNNFGLGDSHEIDGSAGPDINNHIFLIGQSIDIPSPSAEVSSNLIVLNADPAGYTLIPPQSNSIYLNAPGGVFVNGSAISASLNPAALTNSDTRNIQFLGTFTRSNSANGNYASLTDGQLAIGTTNQGRVAYFSQISTGLQIKADSGIVTISTNGNIYGSAFHGSDVDVAGTIVAGGGVTLTGIAGTHSNAAVYLDSDAKLTGLAGVANGAFLGTASGVPTWSFNGGGLTNVAALSLDADGASSASFDGNDWVFADGIAAIRFTATGGIFTGNGGGLTNLNAANLASGSMSYLRLPNSIVATHNIMDFGATGDGVTDDSGALISAMGSGSNVTVIFPPGNYVITNAIVPNNVSLVGIGMPVLSAPYYGYNAYMLDASAATNFSIRNFLMDGKGTSSFKSTSTASNGVAIYANGYAKPGRVENIFFQGWGKAGIEIYQTGTQTKGQGLTVQNCTALNSHTGFKGTFAEYVRWNNCGASLCYYGFDDRNGNNYYTGCSANDCGIGIYALGTGNGTHGSWIGGGLNHSGVAGIIVTNSQFGMVFSGVNIFSSDIRLVNATNTYIDGNFASDVSLRVTNCGPNWIQGSWLGGAPLAITTSGGVPITVNCLTTNAPNQGVFQTSVNVTNTIAARTLNTTTPGFRSTGTNNMILTCPDGGSFILKVANDGTLSATTNTSGL